MTNAHTTAKDRFIEQMGLFVQSEGAPRIAGQILGYLIVEGAPRTLTQMAEALKVSKASASTNARLLELKGAVRRTSPVGQRGDAYQALDMPNTATIRALADRYRAWATSIAEIAGDFPESEAAARARIGRYSAFYQDIAGFLDAWMDQIGIKNAGNDMRDAGGERANGERAGGGGRKVTS